MASYYVKKLPSFGCKREHLKILVFLCEQIIQAKTPDFTRRILYEREKRFSVQRKIGDFHQDFYIQQIEKLAYHHSYYRILGKHHVAGVRHKAFESAPGNIINWSDYA